MHPPRLFLWGQHSSAAFTVQRCELFIRQDEGGGFGIFLQMRKLISPALENNGWNRQNTAEMLGINRTTLYKKMKKFGIQFEKQLNP